MFNLARALKAIPSPHEANGRRMITIAQEVAKRARASFPALAGFLTRAWGRVRVPAGHNPFEDAIRAAAADPSTTPDSVRALDDPQLSRLARICRELACSNGGRFSLSSRQAAKALGANDHHAGLGAMGVLVALGVIERTSRGKPGRGGPGTAARYRWIGDADADAEDAAASRALESDIPFPEVPDDDLISF